MSAQEDGAAGVRTLTREDDVVAVIMGGPSSEAEVSRTSAAAVLAALKARGWNAQTVELDEHLPATLSRIGATVAWLATHGPWGEDGCLQGLLEVLGLPYTGSGVVASALAMDKAMTKQLLRGTPDVHLAEGVVLKAGEPVDLGALPVPSVVKPIAGGSTLGMSKVTQREELAAAVAHALTHDDQVLVESFVQGEEITVAVLQGRALPVVHIAPDEGFFDFAAKYSKGRTVYTVPAPLPEETTQPAQRAAVAAYRALGCQGLARADFLVEPSGRSVFLEINTLPGMTPTSLSPMAAAEVGISFEQLVETILLGAHVRRRVAPAPAS